MERVMITEDMASSVDKSLAELPHLLSREGLILKQKMGYKAGKLLSKRNWCQFVDGDVQIRIQFPNAEGKLKTWKLFARFNNLQPPSQPWDKPERYEYKKAQWMIAGNDVWGITYDDLMEWLNKTTAVAVLERLVKDLQTSFVYSRYRYC